MNDEVNQLVSAGIGCADFTRTLEHVTFLFVTAPPCPPALASRRRIAAPGVEEDLASRLRRALRVPSDQRVELSEWISLDSRAAPHVLFTRIGAGGSWRCFMIEKAAERVVDADIHRALRSKTEWVNANA
ncbi:MAG TPA: hypothetical protein VGC79_03615 [Polyangiaceae bacterium]